MSHHAETSAPVFTFSRTFNASRDRVFAAFTDPDQLTQWWGPKDFDNLVKSIDLRPGGVYHYSMTMRGGDVWWGRLLFEEITAPDRLVLVTAFSDESGNVARAPFSADWPLEVRSIFEFSETDGKTLLKMHSIPLTSHASELEQFGAFTKSMEAGYGASMDQLDALLAGSIH